tara:strand:+ start:361 stop:597 length:237 start_codon:yes stop_codon:yes gene_type:complete
MTIQEQFNQLTKRDKDLLKSFGKVINFCQDHNQNNIDSQLSLDLENKLSELESSLFKIRNRKELKELIKLINTFIGID